MKLPQVLQLLSFDPNFAFPPKRPCCVAPRRTTSDIFVWQALPQENGGLIHGGRKNTCALGRSQSQLRGLGRDCMSAGMSCLLEHSAATSLSSSTYRWSYLQQRHTVYARSLSVQQSTWPTCPVHNACGVNERRSF